MITSVLITYHIIMCYSQDIQTSKDSFGLLYIFAMGVTRTQESNDSKYTSAQLSRALSSCVTELLDIGRKYDTTLYMNMH